MLSRFVIAFHPRSKHPLLWEWWQPGKLPESQVLLSLGALWAPKFTFGGPKSLMAVISLFIDMVGNTPFLKP